jgi:hypothetical protein
MYCPNCGNQITDESLKFCSACGHDLNDASQQEAALSETPQDAALSPHPAASISPRFRRKGWLIGGVVAVVLVAFGAVFTVIAKPFASGKQLILDSINTETFASATQSAMQPVQESMAITLNNVQTPMLSGIQAGMLSTLSGATINLNLLYEPKNEEARVDFDSKYQSIAHHGSLWVDKNMAVLNASDYQSLLAPVLPQGLTMPKYLVTDPIQAQSIQAFWSNLDAKSNKLTKNQRTSIITLEKILVQAIPDKYIHRPSLNAISIDFDQAGLEDILKSEVKAVYANKQQVADAVSAVSQLNKTAPQYTSKQQVLDALNQMPEEAAMAAITTTFNSGLYSISKNSLTVTKKMFGKGLSESFNGGVSIHTPAVSLTVNYRVSAHSPATGIIKMPSTDASNSKTFTQWVMETQAGAGGL